MDDVAEVAVANIVPFAPVEEKSEVGDFPLWYWGCGVSRCGVGVVDDEACC